MSKAMPVAEEPSIESLLDSIRRAIHDEYTSAAPEANAPAVASAPRAAVRRSSAAQQQPGPVTAALKRRPSPAPHLRAGPQDNPRAPSPAPRPLIAPLAPQLEGSLRDLKVNIQPAATIGPAQASPSEELRALRSRTADLSATRARLASIASAGPSTFASVLGGATKPEQAVRGPRTFTPAPPPAPPPVNALRGGVAAPDQVSWEARPVAAAPVPPLDLPPLERTAAAPHAAAFGSDDSYIEQPLPDPGPSDYAADAWERIEEGEPEAEHAIPALPAEADHQRAMLSQEVAEATATAFDRLADTIVSQASGGARSIEDITRDLLRPMLKAWLDANLQGVVERLVREEIDRVSRRSGR